MSIEKLGKVDFENSEIELVFSMMPIIFNLNVNETIYKQSCAKQSKVWL